MRNDSKETSELPDDSASEPVLEVVSPKPMTEKTIFKLNFGSVKMVPSTSDGEPTALPPKMLKLNDEPLVQANPLNSTMSLKF